MDELGTTFDLSLTFDQANLRTPEMQNCVNPNFGLSVTSPALM